MKYTAPFKVAEYIRLSREDGDKAESDSIGNQRKLIADYLKGKDDLVLYDTYVDGSDKIGLNQIEPYSKGGTLI